MISTCHIAPGHWSGHMRIFHRFCHTLAGNGYGVHLIAHPGGTRDEDPRIYFHFLKGAYAFSLNWRLLHRVRRCNDAFHRAVAVEADIYHVYSPEFIPWAIRLKRKTGKPVIFDCMEDFEGMIRQRPGIPSIIRWGMITGLRYLLSRASRDLDAISVADAGTARVFCDGKANVVLLHNLPRLDLFPDDPPSAPPSFDLVFHGGMNTIYLQMILDIDDALVERGRLATWLLFGNMEKPNWFASELVIRKATDRFTIGGMIPHDSVRHQIRKARIGMIPLPMLPKYQNNLPQKLFEYMSLRIPVVIGDMPPVRPFIGDGRCAVLVEPSNPSAYAQAIIQLLRDPDICRTMGALGRERVETAYCWEKESEKLLDLYFCLTASESRSASCPIR